MLTVEQCWLLSSVDCWAELSSVECWVLSRIQGNFSQFEAFDAFAGFKINRWVGLTKFGLPDLYLKYLTYWIYLMVLLCWVFQILLSESIILHFLDTFQSDPKGVQLVYLVKLDLLLSCRISQILSILQTDWEYFWRPRWSDLWHCLIQLKPFGFHLPSPQTCISSTLRDGFL